MRDDSRHHEGAPLDFDPWGDGHGPRCPHGSEWGDCGHCDEMSARDELAREERDREHKAREAAYQEARKT